MTETRFKEVPVFVRTPSTPGVKRKLPDTPANEHARAIKRKSYHKNKEKKQKKREQNSLSSPSTTIKALDPFLSEEQTRQIIANEEAPSNNFRVSTKKLFFYVFTCS